jgi:hypothetical protein
MSRSGWSYQAEVRVYFSRGEARGDVFIDHDRLWFISAYSPSHLTSAYLTAISLPCFYYSNLHTTVFYSPSPRSLPPNVPSSYSPLPFSSLPFPIPSLILLLHSRTPYPQNPPPKPAPQPPLTISPPTRPPQQRPRPRLQR